jgi:hypothetical protein
LDLGPIWGRGFLSAVFDFVQDILCGLCRDSLSVLSFLAPRPFRIKIRNPTPEIRNKPKWLNPNYKTLNLLRTQAKF